MRENRHILQVIFGYPESVIDKSFSNAKLQGPESKPANYKNILPFLSTYCSNFDKRSMVQWVNQKLKQSQNESINGIFGERQSVFLSLKQPPNFLRLLSLNRKKHIVASKFV